MKITSWVICTSSYWLAGIHSAFWVWQKSWQKSGFIYTCTNVGDYRLYGYKYGSTLANRLQTHKVMPQSTAKAWPCAHALVIPNWSFVGTLNYSQKIYLKRHSHQSIDMKNIFSWISKNLRHIQPSKKFK